MYLTPEMAQPLVEQIIAELPGAWEAVSEESDWQIIARTADGEQLCFDVLSAKGRLAVSGLFGELAPFLPHRSPPCTITVDAGRPPARLARDLERRLLAGYRAARATARERQAEHEARTRSETATTEQIVRALGGTVRVQHDNPHAFSGTPATTYQAEAGKLYAKGQVSATSGIKLELNGLSLSQVQRVIAALA